MTKAGHKRLLCIHVCTICGKRCKTYGGLKCHMTLTGCDMPRNRLGEIPDLT